MSAVRALDGEDLRTFVLETLESMDEAPRRQLEDALLRRAATKTGWRPAPPSEALVAEVEHFAEAARRVGQADPGEVDEYLRQGMKASLAGDHAAAQSIFAALLSPIGNGDIDLGQHELVDEVLAVDLNDCVARYLAAVYLTTPIPQRADALLEAVSLGHSFGYAYDPLGAIEKALSGPIPDIDQLLPLWIDRLTKSARSERDWESDEERWLRQAVERHEGVAGLECIARATKRPEAVRAWCAAVAAAGDWQRTLVAYEAAAELVSSETWRGDFLDGAALAAQVLHRKDATAKLEAAWLGAPSLPRLLRWLDADNASAAMIERRAAKALNAKATKSPRLTGLLHVFVGDITIAAKLLQQAPGLGWSNGDHPGHLLFSVFVWMLGGGAVSGSLRERVLTTLSQSTQSRLDEGFDGFDDLHPQSNAPRLSMPDVLDLLRRLNRSEDISAADRAIMLEALKAAAARRTDGVLAEKRRRHYEHAALLIGCCVELDLATSKDGIPSWIDVLRARASRFPAFQAALRVALAEVRGDRAR
jgi:hypothetical protein